MIPPQLDQRNFAVFTDPEKEEVLGRGPAGTEAAFAAGHAMNRHYRATKTRLEEALKEWDGNSPTIRFLKDEYRYFLRYPTKIGMVPIYGKRGFWRWLLRKPAPILGQKEGVVEWGLKEFKSRVWTVHTAIQVPVYIRLFNDGSQEFEDWLKRMDRRLISQDGKSRKEMVDAFQSQTGRVLPAEMGGPTILQVPAQNGQKPPKRGLLAPLRESK